MKLKTVAISVLLAISLCGNAQTQFKVSENLYSSLPDTLTNQIINSLDKLLVSIDNEQLDTNLIDGENADMNQSFFAI